MLSFFRRIVHSKVGVVVTFIILGIIAIAFAAGDISSTQLPGSGGGLGDGEVAEIGDEAVTVAELRTAAQEELEAARQQQPTLDMATFLGGGALDTVVQRLVTVTGLAEFGREAGLVVSKRLVDGEIASIPQLRGPTGKFDENLYRRLLAERRLTDARVREDIRRDIMVRHLTGPTVGASQMSEQLAIPYASLLLERRAGQLGIIPAGAVDMGAAPTSAELLTFYARNLSHYRVPERRVVRFARVTPAAVGAAPSEAEIAQAYAADRARYEPTEKRTIVQVVVAAQAAANQLAARVRGGTPLAAAAQAAGLEPTTATGVEKAAFASQTSPALADAAFAAARGAVVGPVRTPLGYSIARVEAVEAVPGRSLAQARDEIVTALTTRKRAEALANLRASIDDALADGSTFDEAVADAKLQAQTTPALAAGGVDPARPGQQTDPAIAPLVAAAFSAEDGDGPQLVSTGADGGFAIVAVGQVLPAAPRPFAEVRERVTADFAADRRRQAARRLAEQVLAKVNGGTAMAQAFSSSGRPLPAPRPLTASRGEVARLQGPTQAPLALMFSMAEGTAKLLEAPDGAGWYIIRLDRIQRGDASKIPAAVAAARADIARLVGREYTEQFARAAGMQVGSRIDAEAIARVRADLAGQGGAGN